MPNPNVRMTLIDGPIGDVRNALLSAAAKTLTDARHPLAVAYDAIADLAEIFALAHRDGEVLASADRALRIMTREVKRSPGAFD